MTTKKRKRYRYITCGLILEKDKISDFRLLAANNVKPNYHNFSAIKVEIPEDMKLSKWSCDSYSTTNDQRTLGELSYDVVLWNKKERKWIVRNDLKGINPCDFHDVLKQSS